MWSLHCSTSAPPSRGRGPPRVRGDVEGAADRVDHAAAEDGLVFVERCARSSAAPIGCSSSYTATTSRASLPAPRSTPRRTRWRASRTAARQRASVYACPPPGWRWLREPRVEDGGLCRRGGDRIASARLKPAPTAWPVHPRWWEGSGGRGEAVVDPCGRGRTSAPARAVRRLGARAEGGRRAGEHDAMDGGSALERVVARRNASTSAPRHVPFRPLVERGAPRPRRSREHESSVMRDAR